MNAYEVENHMVIDNERSSVEREREIRDHENMELVKSGAERLLNGGEIATTFYCTRMEKNVPINYTFDDVLVQAWEDDSFAECIKQIMLIVPGSQLAQLVKHKAKVVAAEALDIDVEL